MRGERLAADSALVTLRFTYQSAGDIYNGTKRRSDRFRATHRRWAIEAEVGWQITDHFRLNVTVPRVHRYFRQYSAKRGWDRRVNVGLGDATVLGVWYPWAMWAPEGHEETFFDPHHLHFFFGATLPTGKETEQFGGFGDFRQTGSGTLDLILGGTFAPPLAERLRLFLTTTAVVPTGRSTDAAFRPGNELRQQAGLSFTVVDRLSLFVSADFTFRGRVRGGSNNAARRSSGGFFIDVSPGLTVEFAPGWGLTGTASIPVHRDVLGSQLVFGPFYSLGIWKRF